ncbi:MAG: nitronate monooxygenase family protein [Alphaproteobacteria bacterium]|nr:nitronate monooxygenase family protein [Alphaproteobacteria bacterium]
MWPNRRLLDLIGIELPIIQAPMAGSNGSAMAIAVSEAGGLGSLPCAILDAAKVRAEIGIIRQRTTKPINVNFFCHTPAKPDPERDAAWKAKLKGYYTELGLDASVTMPAISLAPFDDALCNIVEDLKPEVVSFHFGLPAQALLSRVKASGCLVLSSATTVEEARWLEGKGCDAIVAQGYEAGGHRGMFLTDNIATQAGTFALVPQVVDAVKVPVVAAGGIADGRGIAAAFALGAAGTQIGTAYLFTPESLITDLHRAELRAARDDRTALTNVFTGRPARSLMNRIMHEIGPMSEAAPSFPTAGGALAPLKKKAEAAGVSDFSSLWAGQAASLGSEIGTGDLTRQLAEEAGQRLKALASPS